MDWMQLLQEIFQVCIIPMLGILTVYAVQFIRAKSEELKEKTDNELEDKYIDMLADTIEQCVIATNQTYVDALKNKDAFNAKAQKEAFKKTYEAVMAILSDEAKEYLTAAYGDLETYITKRIEAEVNLNKTTVNTTVTTDTTTE